jgi:hypothetical protein
VTAAAEHLPCSDGSRARAEPLTATASRAERWVLVEQCGAWGPLAVPLARMDAALAGHVTGEARRGGARLLLLRHPRGVECPPGRTVFLVDSRPGRERVLSRVFADDAELLGTPLPVGALHDEPAGWTAFEGPLLLVCTHGSHDRCCAVRGRPVAEALAARYPERTWECSHVGGDRFAANLVVMPEGHYVSRLEAAQAPGVVADLKAGRLPLAHYRGRSSLPLPVQAAEHVARTATGRTGTDDLVLREQVVEGDDTWTVRLAGAQDLPDVEVRVRFVRAARPPARLTCGALEQVAAPEFACLGLTVLTPAS